MRKRADVSRRRAVTAETYLVLENGAPVRVRSRASNLDRAFDDACQDVGRPLDCGSWEPAEDQEGAKPDTWWELRVELPGKDTDGKGEG